ncbi:MAG: DUF4214 domain-containing protein [Clostridiales bacterium]|nr:DUF4214 domain-containing protein [Clostridiales bacterium]
MKKHLLSILLALVMIIGMMPFCVLAQDGSESGEYGSFVDGDQVISQLIEKSGMNAHPRIIMTEEKIKSLRSHIGDDSVTAILLEELRAEADRIVREVSLPVYNAYGDAHLLETSKSIQRHVAALALSYNIFGDEKYAKRCYQELEAACKFQDWSPKHFLDTAEMCTAFAYGYDWLYNWMTSEQRTLLRTNLIKKGLNQVMEDYTNTPEDRKRTYKWYQDKKGDNWQLVCTGGTNLAALAIGDESDARDVASKVLTYGFKRAYSFVRRAYSVTDGTYIEGLGYWDYATYYLGLQSSALKSATGTDYGLADYEGIRKSVEFVRYMSSNTPKSFSFGDDRDSRNTGWAVFLWLGEQLDSPEYSAIRLKNISIDPEFNYLDVLWIDESKQTSQSSSKDTDWGAVGAANASFRNTWDKSGMVTALHVGENNYTYHGHYDLGSFYIEANESRFFTDLGNENYKLENRQRSYRIKAEGHNTLVINPTEEIDQREGANCLITGYKSGNTAYAITDLTDAYTPSGAKSVIRGLKMIKDKECVVIQDEISLDKPGDIYWFAHTMGQIDVAGDGRSAIVTVGSDRLWVGLLSEGGKLTKMNAEPLPTSLQVSGATKNDEYRKLAIHLSDTKTTTITVACILLKNGEKSPSWTPSVKAISEWPREVEPGSGTPTPTQTPTPKRDTPTPKPTKSATPVPTKKATPVPTRKTTPVPTGKATPVPTKASTPVPTKKVTPSPTKKATPTKVPGKATSTPKPGVPTKAPGQPTATPKPGKPTPTTAPGKPTPTRVPGKPTSTPKPGVPTPTPDPKNEASVADFVERLYTIALDRESEPEGKAFWINEIENGTRTGGDCAHFFLIEAEEFLNRGLTDEDFVETLYLTFFDRASEANGKVFWLGELKNGRMTKENVINGFIDSTEWCNVCATYGVKSGAPTAKAEFASKNAVKFATRLYTECLGREPEESGLKYWSLALTNLEATGYQAASMFFTLPEFTGLKTTNEEYLIRLYTTFMGRDPDVDGFTYWRGLLNDGTDRVDVMKSFAGCPEFQEICDRYGIVRGTI